MRGEIICPYPTRDFHPGLLEQECFICQPASFLWRNVFAEVGMLDAELDFGLDYEFWIRLAKQHRMLRIPGYLAGSQTASPTLHTRDRPLKSYPDPGKSTR